ncbi:ENV1 protein, partial [Burhinus bistriatus]|nr:ENV1 protein [Burhinus bistriatus]
TLRDNLLWNLMKTTYQVVNRTHPNLTQHCWLCYDAKPPYYEAVGIRSRPGIAKGNNPSQCKWENNRQGISLSQVTGKGRCVG